MLFSDAFSFQSYLNTFAFKNTVYTNLWDHLQQVSTCKFILSHMHTHYIPVLSQQAAENTAGLNIPHTVHDIMNRWTLQMGFPVVTIDTHTGRITQKHFLLDPESAVERPSQFK